MPHQLFEDAFGDTRNASTLLAACQITYWPADSGAEAFKNDFGMEARLISFDNTQAYLATNDDHVLVAFRGSEDPTSIDGLKDWFLTNAVNLLIHPQGVLSTEFAAAGIAAKYHQGFVDAITEIWPQLYPAVEAELKKKDRPLWVTGHSLGGALATLAAWLFKRKFLNVHQVYTFGAPMVGNKELSEAINREFPNKFFRYVNGPDPVPLLPMMSLAASDYLHCDKLMILGPHEAAANLIVYLGDAAGGMVQGVLSGDIREKVWEALKSKLTSHLLPDYRQLIGG